MPLCQFLVAPVKDLLIGALWFVPLVSMQVSWRGHRMHVGPDTRLAPVAATQRRARLRLPGLLRPKTA
jgi:hypothetical protein